MQPLAPDLYARWRGEGRREVALREGASREPPTELVLQHIWRQQRLQREALRTLDGRPVTVLHPGFWNREAGPDFRDAVLQIGAERIPRGDVEIDLQPAAWRQHGHDRNPAYRGVRLHVVWRGDGGPPPALPTLPLAEVLDAPLGELVDGLGGSPKPDLAAAPVGACAPALNGLRPEALIEVLQQAALTRLRLKAGRFQARARQAGWEQALWEGLFAALGYKQNSWPMRRVAELLPCLFAPELPGPVTVFDAQARLLGVAGLLPNQLTGRPDADDYLRRAWDVWWRLREPLAEVSVPRSAWRLHGLRPANHPQRRLAAAAHWIANPSFVAGIEQWIAAEIPDSKLVESLAARLRPEGDDFWSWHWTLRAGRMAVPQLLIGAARVTDLGVNVLLPWLWSRAAAGSSVTVRATVEHRYLAWPAAEDNSLLRLARQRLLGGRPLPVPRRAALQQGLIQVVRDFCDESNALCENCRLPSLVAKVSGID